MTVSAPNIISTEIKLPASKSISNRALVIRALSNGNAPLENISECDDSNVVVEALRTMPYEINIKAAGTAMRFLTSMLATRGIELKGKKVLISGSGNVAQYTAEKVLQLGGKVLTMSDSDGYIYDPDGIDREKLDYIMELKNLYRGRIRE